MQDEPHPPEILAAVAAFLRGGAADPFQARVAAAAIDLVRRELEHGADPDEPARLRALLGAPPTDSLLAMTAELARRLSAGEMDLTTPGVAAHLWATTRAKLRVDQPNYSGLRTAPKENPA